MGSHPVGILSLCTGGGGLELGLGLAIPGSRAICYVEREISACEVLAARMQDEGIHQAPIWTDVKTFDGKPWRGAVDILAAGYPCQPFSAIGQQKGVDDPRHLWPFVAKIIGDCQPSAVFLENVSNHLNIGFDVVRKELLEMGFRVEAGIFSAAEMGASHSRKRLFVLGYAKGRPIDFPSCQQGREVQAGGRGSSVDGTGPDQGGISSVFPPAPKRWKEWRRIIEDSRQSKPAFLDVDDELASGLGKPDVDTRESQTRILGNGVVPVVAAYAFSILRRRLEERD